MLHQVRLSPPPSWLFEVFGFLSLKEHYNLLVLNKSWNQIQHSSFWWQILCFCIAKQYKLFCTPKINIKEENWKNIFNDLWNIKNLWSSKQEINTTLKKKKKKKSTTGILNVEEVKEELKLQVYVRIRPLLANDQELQEKEKGSENNYDIYPNLKIEKVHLPLHQRINLLKAASKQKNLSTKEALLLLKKQGDWFSNQDIENEAGENKEAEDCINDDSTDIFLLNSGKQRFGFQIHTVLEDSGQLIMSVPGSGFRNFEFNGILGENSSQKLVYEITCPSVVRDLLNGRNATIFVYGQTGSGKTFTMYGPDDDCAIGDDIGTDLSGIVPRICHEIFSSLQTRLKIQKIFSEIEVSYVEVYGDQVFDLLRGGIRCGHSVATASRYVLDGQASVKINDNKDIRKLLKLGEETKTKAKTRMNDRSTRAHSVLILKIKQWQSENSSKEIESSLILSDLGGSERIQNSDVSGVQLSEAKDINLGLLALKQVISALNKKQKHIPFNQHKLTMLLSEGLGGNSRTKAVICVNPKHGAETLQSLRFGEECSLIKTNVKFNSSCSLVVDLLEKINLDIENLENTIKQKERWETFEVRRLDNIERLEVGTLEEEINKGGGELIKTSKLVGAEKERLALEALLDKKREILGFT